MGKKYKRDSILTKLDNKSLYTTIERRTAAIIELILKTGATPIDITGLRRTDFDLRRRQVTIQVNKKKQVQANTQQVSTQCIFELVKIDFSRLSPRRIQQLIKTGAKQIGSNLSTARALRKKYLETAINNPQQIQSRTQLRSIKQREILTKQEIAQVLQNTKNKRDFLLFKTLLETGLRISELIQLEGKHLFEGNLIIEKDISYNKKERIIAIRKELYAAINTTGPLFANNRGKPISMRRFEQICKHLGEKIGLTDLSPSLLRATAVAGLSKKLSSEKLMIQTGLGTDTIYTHGFSSKISTNTQKEETTRDEKPRKDDGAQYHASNMYVKSRLRHGGDTDE